MGGVILISITLAEQIRRHVAGDPALERCGLLLGRDDRIEAAPPCTNVAADPVRRFEIDPAALLAAHRAARAGGGQVLGHYHSHPGGGAHPSPRDAADAAGDGALWMILGGREIGLFRAVAGGPVHGAFAPLTLRQVTRW